MSYSSLIASRILKLRPIEYSVFGLAELGRLDMVDQWPEERMLMHVDALVYK
jgi:hypothetical protein